MTIQWVVESAYPWAGLWGVNGSPINGSPVIWSQEQLRKIQVYSNESEEQGLSVDVKLFVGSNVVFSGVLVVGIGNGIWPLNHDTAIEIDNVQVPSNTPLQVTGEVVPTEYNFTWFGDTTDCILGPPNGTKIESNEVFGITALAPDGKMLKEIQVGGVIQEDNFPQKYYSVEWIMPEADLSAQVTLEDARPKPAKFRIRWHWDQVMVSSSLVNKTYHLTPLAPFQVGSIVTSEDILGGCAVWPTGCTILFYEEDGVTPAPFQGTLSGGNATGLETVIYNGSAIGPTQGIMLKTILPDRLPPGISASGITETTGWWDFQLGDIDSEDVPSSTVGAPDTGAVPETPGSKPGVPDPQVPSSSEGCECSPWYESIAKAILYHADVVQSTSSKQTAELVRIGDILEEIRDKDPGELYPIFLIEGSELMNIFRYGN